MNYRRLYIYFGLLAALGAALVLAGVAAADPPPPDAVPVDFTITNPAGSGVVNSVYFLEGQSFPSLPSADCAFTPASDRYLAHPELYGHIFGWKLPTLMFGWPTTVSLHGDVHGSINDAAGNRYRLSGTFDETGMEKYPDWIVPFDGYGHLTLAGPAGVLTGDAEFIYVADYPVEWQFMFTNIQNCRIL
jgi:hypothetical protein